jgi:PAS domain S-box-containing protein
VVGLVAAATFARAAVDPFVSLGVPFSFHFIAVAGSVWVAGFGGGVLAIALSVFAVDFFFMEPRYSFLLSEEQIAGSVVFASVALGLAWLTNRWRIAERTARESQQLLRMTLDNFPTVLAFKDEQGRFIEVNPAVEQTLGRPKSEIIGRSMDAFVPVEAASVLRQHDDQVLRERTAAQFEERTPLPGGTLYQINTIFPLVDTRGHVYGTGHISHDITEVKRAHDALEKMSAEIQAQAEQLATANRIKDEFLATLSHELRTPINTILGWAQILSTLEYSEERTRRGLDAILRLGQHQARLVEDLLDVSRIISGSVRISVQPVDVLGAIEHALDGVRPSAEARRLSLSTEVESGLQVPADPVRFQQVLWNLLSNAVKFTPEGGSVRISARSRDGFAEITVTDTGVGIAPDFLPHVFERFRQADSSATRQHTGLGLGLAIVRHIVELHGGTVEASSAGLGGGAEFTVRLPLTRAGSRDGAAAGEAASRA